MEGGVSIRCTCHDAFDHGFFVGKEIDPNCTMHGDSEDAASQRESFFAVVDALEARWKPKRAPVRLHGIRHLVLMPAVFVEIEGIRVEDNDHLFTSEVESSAMCMCAMQIDVRDGPRFFEAWKALGYEARMGWRQRAYDFLVTIRGATP